MDIEVEISGMDGNEKHLLNELLTRHVASQVIKAGDTVFDLGANVGFHTTDFSGRVGPEGLVHAFEPNPALWPHLYHHSNVRVWPYAAGDRLSVERFILPVNHDQVGSLVDARDFMGDIPVRILTVVQVDIDSLVEAIANPISFIKIDVERHELFALRGLKNTIEKYKPPIVFENNTPEIDELLSSFGYVVRELLSNAAPGVTLSNVLAQHESKFPGSNGDIIPSAAEAASIVARCKTA